METIEERDFGPRAVELLNRVAHGERFEIVKDGRAIGRFTPAENELAEMPGRRTFNDWLASTPRLDDLELPDRGTWAMREVDL